MITKEQVLRIAKLSKFELDEKEIEMYQGQLSSILTFVEQLAEVDTENVEPTYQVTGLQTVLRDDEVKEAQAQFVDLLNNSTLPKVAHQILVKKVL